MTKRSRTAHYYILKDIMVEHFGLGIYTFCVSITSKAICSHPYTIIFLINKSNNAGHKSILSYNPFFTLYKYYIKNFNKNQIKKIGLFLSNKPILFNHYNTSLKSYVIFTPLHLVNNKTKNQLYLYCLSINQLTIDFFLVSHLSK